MIPRKVVLENFLSFGTPAATIAFADGEPLWVLSGPNGIGKSAVFDAITYALFGCHRGGQGRGMDDLVRHGSNGFRIEFEFGVGGREFRITRSRVKKSVERLFHKVGDAWAEIDTGGGKDAIKAWAERELGLTFDQFTASVLLRQGEADRIILASGKDRLLMLKKVIGVERYEALSARVHKATRDAAGRKEKAAEEVARVPAVGPAEFATAVTAAREAESAVAAAQAEEEAAAGRVAQAAEFARLSSHVDELTRELEAAAARRAAADRIRVGHARLLDLDAAVPVLTRLVPARDARDRAAPDVARHAAAEADEAAAVTAATTTRDDARAAAAGHKLRADEAAAALRATATARTADETALKVAEEVEGIDRDLAAFPADLDDQTRAAADALAAARAAAADARDTHVAARTEHTQRDKELTTFGGVEAGATCSRCRQPVTAEHAEAERQALADAVARLRDALATAKAAAADTTARETAAAGLHTTLDGRRRDHDKLTQRRLGLTRHAATTPAAELRGRLAAHAADADRHTAAAADEQAKATAADRTATAAEAERVAAAARLSKAQADLRAARDRHVTAASTVDALLPSLAGTWAAAWEGVAAADVLALTAEWDGLKAADVAADFRALNADDALDAERARRRDAAREQIAAIPEAARVPVAAAEAAVRAARADVDAAAAARDAAGRALAALHQRAEDRAALLDAEKATAIDARVHATLDRLLGADGLQRELVRTAERQIVRYADETVRHLSDGDLSIELDDAEDGPDQAFTLRVRRADDPNPIGVCYLSGSQKFRVAVAVALGIGRFATAGTQARPLESVIIDEGFGSLDKDGLRCMADELHRLQDRTALKRVVLVSHQEEFVGRFPVGYRLSRGEAGTTAEPFRRG